MPTYWSKKNTKNTRKMENVNQNSEGIKTITASKARELSEQNQEKNLELLFTSINYAIKEGRYSMPSRLGLNINQLNELLSLGYGIKKHNDPMTFDEVIVISW